ncbi:MAG: helix-turn-helix domain-containing protein [Christensenellales bacterium]
MNIGAKLRRLRLMHNLTQEELADRAELSKGFISQVENNLTSPSIATLTDLLECLGSSLTSFFSEKADEKIVFSAQDLFEKSDDQGLKGVITWLVPNAQKNRMEPMLVTLHQDGRTQVIPPHDGEEIGYVFSGCIDLVVGDRRCRVKAGESFCLHPAETHYITNAAKRAARFIWVSTPPSF